MKCTLDTGAERIVTYAVFKRDLPPAEWCHSKGPGCCTEGPGQAGGTGLQKQH